MLATRGFIVAGGDLLLREWSTAANGVFYCWRGCSCCWDGSTVKGGVCCCYLLEGLLMLTARRSIVGWLIGLSQQ